MASSSNLSANNSAFPPFPTPGPAEDSVLAQQNFIDREQASRSWLKRILLSRKATVVPFQRVRRKSVATADANHPVEDLAIRDLERSDVQSVSEPGDAQDMSTATVAMDRTDINQELDKIYLKDDYIDDPRRNEHLYRWAMIYENQRGFSFFSATQYSTRSLLPSDPPPFTVVAPESSLINGRPVKASKSNQPDVSLLDYPLPDGNWRWASKEWMIDMRSENISYDGFEYNWIFRRQHWRRKAGRFNSGGWVRRRRWIRLMERPPLNALEKEQKLEKPVLSTPVTTENVWRGDGNDWSRLSRLMRDCGRDARMLDVWEMWIHPTGCSHTNEKGSVPADQQRPDPGLISDVVRVHMDELLRYFVYPRSRVQLFKLFIAAGIVDKFDLATVKVSSPFYDDFKEATKD